jgi:hypothetical protein
MDRSFRNLTLTLTLAAALLTWGGCAGGGTATGGTAAAGSSSNQVLDLASRLSGTFRGTSPGNDLRIDLRSTGDSTSGQAINLFATVSGQLQGQTVNEQLVVHLRNEGRDVLAALVPHFDPTVSSLSAESTTFTDAELRAACTFYLARRRGTYQGATPGSASCARAVRGAGGTWGVQVGDGTLLLQREGSGQALTFQRAG